MREVADVETLDVAVVVNSNFAGERDFDGFGVEVVVLVIDGADGSERGDVPRRRLWDETGDNFGEGTGRTSGDAADRDDGGRRGRRPVRPRRARLRPQRCLNDFSVRRPYRRRLVVCNKFEI